MLELLQQRSENSFNHFLLYDRLATVFDLVDNLSHPRRKVFNGFVFFHRQIVETSPIVLQPNGDYFISPFKLLLQNIPCFFGTLDAENLGVDGFTPPLLNYT